MKNLLFKIGFILTLIFCLSSCSANNSSNTFVFNTNMNVTRYSRDTTSGTRDGFFTAINYKDGIKDDTKIPNATIVDSNGVMISSIKNDSYGIGYISLASLESSGLKGLNYENILASEENVVNGTYGLSRNFNYVTRIASDMTSDEQVLLKAFMAYMFSKEGLAIIKSKDGILTSSISSAKSFAEIKAEDSAINEITSRRDSSKITINFGGSTSVEKIATALTSAFAEECPIFSSNHNHTGSGDAYKGTQGSEKNGTGKLHIGFLSRELSSSEIAAEETSGMICKDGIVVVVNSVNSALDNITGSALTTIYSSSTIKWNSI